MIRKVIFTVSMFITLALAPVFIVFAEETPQMPLLTLSKNCAKVENEFDVRSPFVRGPQSAELHEIVASFTVNEKGSFSSVSIVAGSGNSKIDDAFLQSLQRWRISPLKVNGTAKQCDMEVTFYIRYGKGRYNKTVQDWQLKDEMYAAYQTQQDNVKKQQQDIASNSRQEPLDIWHQRVQASFGTKQGVAAIEQNLPQNDQLSEDSVNLLRGASSFTDSSAMLTQMSRDYLYISETSPYSPALGYPFINEKQETALKALFSQYVSQVSPKPAANAIRIPADFVMPSAKELALAQLQIGYYCAPGDKECVNTCGFYPGKYNSAELIRPNSSPNLLVAFMTSLGIFDQMAKLSSYNAYVGLCLPHIQKNWAAALPDAYKTLHKFNQFYQYYNQQRVPQNRWVGFKRYCDKNRYMTSPFDGTDACEFLSAIYYGDFETAVSIDVLASLPLESKYHPAPVPRSKYFYTNPDIVQVIYTQASKAFGGYIKHYSDMQGSCGDASVAYTITVENKTVRTDRYGRNLGTISDNSYEETYYIPKRLERYAPLYVRDSGKEGMQSLGNQFFVESANYDGRLIAGLVIKTMNTAVPRFECGSVEQKALEQQLIRYLEFLPKYNQAARQI